MVGRIAAGLLAVSLLMYQALVAAQTTPPAQDTIMDGQINTQEEFAASERRWMKAQAQYHRNQQYAEIIKATPLDNPQRYYRNASLIEAQLHIAYARIELKINESMELALAELDKAVSFIENAKQDASQGEVTQIEQITNEIARIRDRIVQGPPLAERSKESRQRLRGVSSALQRIVVSG